MNKLAILALALVACCGAVAVVLVGAHSINEGAPKNSYRFPELMEEEEESMLSIIPDDDGEKRYLKEEFKVFGDFCVRARDDIQVWMKAATNSAAAKIFNVLFTQIDEASSATLQATDEAVREAADAISSADLTKIPSHAQPTAEQAQNVMTDNVQKVSMMTIIKAGIMAVIRTAVGTIMNQFGLRLARLRAEFDGEEIRVKIDSACKSVSYELQEEVESSFRAARNAIVSATRDPEQAATLKAARLKHVGCLTAGRVLKVATFCELMKAAGPLVFDLLGW